MKRFKIVSLSALIVLIAITNSFALNIGGTKPTSTNPANQTAIDTAWTNLLSQLNGPGGQLEKIDNPTKMSKAFADAATYSNGAATQRGYINYDLFALTFGLMGGAKLPGSNKEDFLDNISDDLEREGDIDAGVNAQIAFQAGMNCSFLVDDLYLGVKFGSIKFNQEYNDDSDEFKFNSFTLGLLANYRLIDEKSIGLGMLKWRGISLGSGLIYQSSKTRYNMDIDSVSASSGGANLSVDPDFEFEIKTKTLSVPLELTTAFRLLWALNMHVGVGADLQLIGKSDMSLGLDGKVSVTGISATSGTLRAKEDVNEKAKIVSPKIMFGLGAGFGDSLIVDVPFTYYFNDGISVGISIGTVW